MAKHNEMGRRGEEIALEFIRKKGYNILDTNWRHRKAEIDIIAKSKDVLIFIEVKSRSSDYYGRPETFVTTKKQQLISDARDSYHVTHFCPQLLAPALANCESSATKKLLQEFFVSELYHDQLMIKSLQSVGMTTQEIEQMQPLPMTFSVCSSLGLFARQHPLSFKAALLIFEEDDPNFGELFIKSCQALNLPKDFYQPILLHSKINEDGAHDDITRVLLSEISTVTPAEQIIVKKNLTVLLESLVLRTQEILS